MKITKEALVKFLIKMVEESKRHQDFDKLNQQKLEMIKKVLRIKEEEINVKRGIVYLETKRKEIGKNLELEEKEIIKEINEKFNIYIETYLKYKKGTLEGKINGIREELFIFQKIDFRVRERVISSHKEQILKEIIEVLKSFIELLYEIDFRKIGEEITIEEYGEKKVLFDKELNQEEENLMNKNLSEIDYLL